MNNKIIDTERKTPGEIMKMLCINFSIAPHPPPQLRCAHRIVRRVLLCGPHTACDRLWLVSH